MSPTPPKEINPLIKFIPDRKYWKSSFAADIKFTHNKTSTNWYKGAIDNTNIYTTLNTSYNYTKENITLTNTLTTKFSIINAPKDTLRNYTVGDDELRLRSVFGLKAIQHWYYSFSTEFISPMSNKYNANTTTKNSALLSPYTHITGLGMTYDVKPKFKKQNRSMTLKLTIDPLSFKYMNSKNLDINLRKYFKTDKEGNQLHIMKTFGSKVVMNQTTKFGGDKYELISRFDYFSNYELVTCEFENTLNIRLSKYFSTKLYLFLRYDDGVKKTEESNTHLQVNRLFALGFNYGW